MQMLMLQRITVAGSLHHLEQLGAQMIKLSASSLTGLPSAVAGSLSRGDCLQQVACWPQVIAAAANALLVLTKAFQANASQQDQQHATWRQQTPAGGVAWNLAPLLDTAAASLVTKAGSTASARHGLVIIDGVCSTTDADVEGKCTHQWGAHLCKCPHALLQLPFIARKASRQSLPVQACHLDWEQTWCCCRAPGSKRTGLLHHRHQRLATDPLCHS